MRAGVVGVAVVTDLVLDDPVAAVTAAGTQPLQPSASGHRSRRHTLRHGDHAVAAASGLAGVQTLVVVVEASPSFALRPKVAVVFRQVGADDIAAAASRLALVAGVVVELIPIVADLGVRVIIFEVDAHDAAAAARHPDRC